MSNKQLFGLAVFGVGVYWAYTKGYIPGTQPYTAKQANGSTQTAANTNTNQGVWQGAANSAIGAAIKTGSAVISDALKGWQADTKKTGDTSSGTKSNGLIGDTYGGHTAGYDAATDAELLAAGELP